MICSVSHVRRAALAALLTLPLALTGCAGANGGVDAKGRVSVVFWHGQTDVPKRTLEALVADFNRTHPRIHVTADSGGVTVDQMLPKITAGLAAGRYPDVSYIFGSDLASLARTGKVADLTKTVAASGVNWTDFWPAARDTATIKGRVRGVPALTDNLAVLYNKKLFAQRNLKAPDPSWSWDDFRATAKALTDQGKGQFGTAWPGVGDQEDTTWRLWPLLWQQGGEIVSPDGRKAAFGSAAGLRALTLLHDLAVTDKSTYVDTSPGGLKMNQLFSSGRIGMVVGGPWLLSDLAAAKLDYGVLPLPGFNGVHTTVDGSDDWVVFDHGSARSKAAAQFVLWLTQPAQEIRWMQATGSLPQRASTEHLPAYAQYLRAWPNQGVWLDTLPQGRARPTLRAYPKLSHAVSAAVVSVLLGQADPAKALRDAVRTTDAALSSGD